MQTAGKNVRRVVVKLFYGFLILLLLPTLLFILPDWVAVKIIFFVAIFKKWIGYTVLAASLSWMLYWLFRDRQKIKKRAFIVLSTVVIGYAFICIVSFFHQSSYKDCDYYTKLLNGGVQEFKGKKYTIKMCGANSFLGSGDHQVKLQVLDDKGELQALRYFAFYWNDAADKELEYSDDYVIYYDNSESIPLNTIKIPPTAIDWIRARLPLFN